MELDNLKDIWQAAADPQRAAADAWPAGARGANSRQAGNPREGGTNSRQAGTNPRRVGTPPYTPGAESLLPLLQQRSRGPVARMRRNLRIELLCIIVSYVPLILFYLVEFQGRFRVISILLFGIGALFCAYYYRKSRLLNTMQCLTCEVRSNLVRQVATLKKYIRFYLLASTIAIPATAVLVYVIFHLRLFYPNDTTVYHSLSPAPWWKSSSVWLLLLVPFTVGMYYANAWYINRLYGRHIKKLQELLREMDEE